MQLVQKNHHDNLLTIRPVSAFQTFDIKFFSHKRRMTSKKKNKSKHKKKKGNLDSADDSLRILLQDEALVYCKMENYEKAIHQYTAALELSPNDKTALVSRSKCYLLLGQPRLALKDAEVALNEDSTYLKAIYQKAEALYHLGDFEHSLVFYHRGLHVRPELEQFRLGVQKAREAIENAIGKMKNTAIVIQQVGWEDKRQATVARTVNGGDGGIGGSRGSTPTVTGSTTRRKQTVTAKSQSKMLLRELCVDKEYLEHLTIDPNIMSAIQENDNYILSEAKDGISFLNGREEFWKQQKLIN